MAYRRRIRESRRIAALVAVMLLLPALLGTTGVHGDECGDPGNGSCYESHKGLGCCDPECCELICSWDPICCDSGWDDPCVDIAIDFCDRANHYYCEQPPADCNGDGLPDPCELISGFSDDCNQNGIPDDCNDGLDCHENGRPDECDLTDEVAENCNGNGIVSGSDLGLLFNSWNSCPGCPADLDGNDVVDGADLGIFINSWGSCP